MKRRIGKLFGTLLLITSLVINLLQVPVAAAAGIEIPQDAIKINGEAANPGNIGNDNNGQEGGYAWIDHGSANSLITYEVTVGTAGWYNFAFRYTAGTVGAAKERTLAIDTNGNLNVSSLGLPDTGTWNTWNTVLKTIQLKAGLNTVTLRSEAVSNGMCLDYFHVWKVTEAATLSSIQFESDSISVEVGKTAPTVVHAVYSDSSTVNLLSGVIYASSDNQIVSIDSSGTITGVGKGTATITATYGTYTATAAVTADIEIPQDAIKINGEAASPGNIGSDNNGQEGSYAWIDHGSANSLITYEVTVGTAGWYNFAFRYTAGTVGAAKERTLAIDTNGHLKVSTLSLPDTGTWNTWNTVLKTIQLEAGLNTITLRSEAVSNGMCLDYFHVWKVTEEATLSSIQFESNSISVDVGKTAPTAVKAVYSDSSTVNLLSGVIYASSNNQIVSIDSSGTVTGLGEGTATITATYGAYTATANIASNMPRFTVDLANAYRPATHVASGMLYGLAEAGRPDNTLIAPIKPKNFTQMAPGGGQLPNGETTPIGDALLVAPIAKENGATVTIRMPDKYPNFPYEWVSWDDWYAKVTSIVNARISSGATNIYAYELWNEPNWTWDTTKAGSFNEGWEKTYDKIKSLDSNTKIMGPSISLYDETYLRNFLTYCKANDCLPDIISWHELGDPEPEGNFRDKPGTPYIKNHLTSYRALEVELGISPRPISINEYGVQTEEGIPGNMVQYFAQFERGGVDTADLAFWFRPGRLSNLITDQGKKNGGWWLYKWYGDMTGNMAMTKPKSETMTQGLDGIASMDTDKETARILFGGTDGDSVIQIKGFSDTLNFGDEVHVKVQATPWYGVDTAVDEPFDYFDGNFEVHDGQISVPLSGLKSSWGYSMIITTSNGTVNTVEPIVARYEAEGARLNRAVYRQSSYASEGRYVGNIDFADSYVQFENVHADATGVYELEIGYANGMSNSSSHILTVNGQSAGNVTYPKTGGWMNTVPNGGNRKTIIITTTLRAGDNTIRLTKGDSYAELDYIRVVGVVPEVGVESVNVQVEDNTQVIVNDSLQISAEVTPSGATNKQVVWSVVNSDDSGTPYARMDQNGLLTGLAPGDVEITATSVDNPQASDTVSLTITRSHPLVVDLTDRYRPVTHAASGSLYGLAEEGRPGDDLIAPTKPLMFTQMAPDGGQLPNGETTPIGDALKVAPIAKRNGAKVTIRMPDIYPNFPYQWIGLDDWNSKVDNIVNARVASGYDNIYAYELWNEPDWTWNTTKAGNFLAGWKNTYNRVRVLDQTTPIMGPSYSIFVESQMRAFLTYCKENNCLPNIISWHELGDYDGKPNPQNIQSRIRTYRQIEQDLGIAPLPISINEYMAASEDTIPGNTIQYIAQFERGGVETANAAFWFRPGRMSNIITDMGEANGSWWLYKWYGDMSGKMTMTVPARTAAMGLDGIASLNETSGEVHVLFGGDNGSNRIVVNGFNSSSLYSERAHVKVEASPWNGVDSAVKEPIALYEGEFDIVDGQITVPITDMHKIWGYHLLITPSSAEKSRYEGEHATLNQVTILESDFVSNKHYVGLMNDPSSYVEFHVKVPNTGTYALRIGYANGTDTESVHSLLVNNEATATVSYPSTGGWLSNGHTGEKSVNISLIAGENTIRLIKGTTGGLVDIDYIQLNKKRIFELRSEAEKSEINDALTFSGSYASDAGYVGFINNSNSYVQHRVIVPTSGIYTMEIGYGNGTSSNASNKLAVNGIELSPVILAPTGGWINEFGNKGNRKIITMTVELIAGENTIRFTKNEGFAELDFIRLIQSFQAVTQVNVSTKNGQTEITTGNTLRFTADVLPADVTESSVTWAVYEPDGLVTNKATINGNGELTAITAGTVKVTASSISNPDVSGSTQITIKDLPSSNADLSGLSVSSGALNPTFASATTSYTQSVANSVTSLMVTPTVSDAKASVKVNGVSVTSDNTSEAIQLNVGANTITVVVKAQDGTTTKTYIITVTRAAASTTSQSDSGSSPTSTPTPTPAPNPEQITVESKVTEKDGSVQSTVDADEWKKALDEANSDASGKTKISLDIKEIAGAKEYVQQLPEGSISSNKEPIHLVIKTAIASIDVPSNMFKGADAPAGDLSLKIAHVDKNSLNSAAKNAVGNHPVIELNVQSGDTKVSWSNPSAPVTVSIPYTPTAQELKNPEHIVVFYIDGKGQVVPVPNGKYDPQTGAVIFSTTHFSTYAVSYVDKTFEDVAALDWAKDQIGTLASKGIINGTSDNQFSPEQAVTRADFLVLLVKTLGLQGELGESFADVSADKYYSDAIRIARKLGITSGDGNNRFNPNAKITREDMMVLTNRALKAAGKQLLTDASVDSIAHFTDKATIAGYAAESVNALVQAGLIHGFDNAVQPKDTTTRAQAAVLIYNLYNYLY